MMATVSRKRPRSEKSSEVVEVTFAEPGLRARSKRPFASNSSVKSRLERHEHEPAPEFRRHEVFQEVMDLGSTLLDKKQRRRLQEAKLVALGCKPTKKPKEPYRITLARNKATAERERKKKAFEEKHGLHVTQPSTRKAQAKTKLTKSDDLLDARDRNFGRFKNGVLTLNSHKKGGSRRFRSRR